MKKFNPAQVTSGKFRYMVVLLKLKIGIVAWVTIIRVK